MKYMLRLLGKIAYMLAWPAYYVYLKRSYGRTRVILQCKNEILVVRQWLSDGKWQLPGGGMYKNEPAVDGAARELQEETGVAIVPARLRKAGRINARARGVAFECMVFVAILDQKPNLCLQPIEIAEAAWVNPGELSLANAHSDVLQCLDAASTSGLLKVAHKDHTSTYA